MRKKGWQIAAMFLVLGMVLAAACAPQAVPAAAPRAPAPAPAAVPASVQAAPAPTAPAMQAWEVEWEKTLAAAKKEGRILVYSTASVHRAPWTAAAARYGLQLELIVGQAVATAEKILRERQAGIYSGDLIVPGSGTGLTTLKPKGAFDPMDAALILPEIKDTKLWFEGRLPFLDKDHTLFGFVLTVFPGLAINTTLVKSGEIKSYNDVLDPKWHGKIVMLDPSVAGTKFSNFGVEVLGLDYMRKLVEAKPTLFRDYRQPMEWMAHGKAAIHIGPHVTTLTAFQQVGAPLVGLVPQEGTWLSLVSGNMALLNNAPHPNAAKVFLNWMLTKEGQTITSKAAGTQSAREDVPTDFLDPVLVRSPGKKFYVFDTEEYLTVKEPENMKTCKEIFKELLK